MSYPCRRYLRRAEVLRIPLLTSYGIVDACRRLPSCQHGVAETRATLSKGQPLFDNLAELQGIDLGSIIVSM
jgi:hypothetical protein